MRQEVTKQPHRYLFILPNLFTLSSLFAGFYAITLLTSSSEGSPRFILASLALLVAAVFDALDGRVARMTRTQSEFGLHMDSLVDLVSFGIAPALLVYKWSLHELGFIGMLVAFAFAGAGACRLARFNVLELQAKKDNTKQGPSRYFVGLPIPLAAGMLVSVIVFVENSAVFYASPIAVVGLTLIMSFLMVSNFHFRTFKDLKLNTVTSSILGFFVLLLAVSIWQLGYAYGLLLIFAGYTIGNLLNDTLGFVYRRIKTLNAAYPKS